MFSSKIGVSKTKSNFVNYFMLTVLSHILPKSGIFYNLRFFRILDFLISNFPISDFLQNFQKKNEYRQLFYGHPNLRFFLNFLPSCFLPVKNIKKYYFDKIAYYRNL